MQHIAGQSTVGGPGGGHDGAHQQPVFIHHRGGYGILGVLAGSGHHHRALIAAGFRKAFQHRLRDRLRHRAFGGVRHDEDIALIVGKVDIRFDGGAQHRIHRLQGIAADVAVLMGGVVFHRQAGSLVHVFFQQTDFFFPQVVIGQHHEDRADQHHAEQNDGAAYRVVFAHQGFLRFVHSYSLTSNL